MQFECLIFETGTAQLIIEPIEKDDKEHQDYVGRFTGVSFDVDDCAAACRSLEDRGVVFDSAPQKQHWGGVLAHFNDPDGYTLTLVEHP